MSRPAHPSNNTSPSDTGNEMGETHTYRGQGTKNDPFIVEFQQADPENPLNWGSARKWCIACIVTLSVFVVTFASSAYSESSVEVLETFQVSTEVFFAGISVYVLGFAIGPAFWAPLVSATPNPLVPRQQ